MIDVSQYEGQPYKLMLALGEPQLAYRVFNLRVLEFYRNDPRYSYETNDIHGHISVRVQSEVGPQDDTFLESFGFAYTKDLRQRYVAAFLIYLSRLTPDHQQRWKLEESNEEAFLHPDYARSTAGDWDTQESMFNAFCEELKIINEMAITSHGRPLFRNSYENAKPIGFGFLIRPTKKEYEAFVHLLDKMMSDNLDKRFFDGKVDLTFQSQKDGIVSEQSKGTISLLADWLSKRVKFSDPTPKDDMIETFKKVRRERGPLAHDVHDDEWDDGYSARQRELMIEAYGALRTLRLILANHHATKSIVVPDWLQKAEIRTF
jgi:hypothetical protein